MTGAINSIYHWGIAVIQRIQTIQSPGLTAFITFFTALGTGYLYLPVILFIFWCVDEKKGVRLGLLLILSVCINGFFKELLKQPRPFSLEPSIGLIFEPTYGIPSGHAQMSLCFALPLALWYGKSAAIRIGAVLFVLLIAFTRLYLGLHFPTDILAGWLLGGLTLALWALFEKRVGTFLSSLRIRLIAAAAVAIGMNALYPADRSLGGLFLGFSAGYALMLEYFPFHAAAGGSGSVRGFRLALGIAGGALIFQVLKMVLPGGDSVFSALPSWGTSSPYYDLGSFIRHGLLGLWASAGAPWLFLRLRLAGKPGQ
jgi:membrane-associated phospholipid phosphatase